MDANDLSDDARSSMPTEWTQTLDALTISVRLPPGASARSVVCTVGGGRACIGLRGGDAPLLDGELWGAISGSVWSVEAGVLSLELDKARNAYWPCALVGDPEVDVTALIERDRRDAEPAYKQDPNASAQPQRVTDKETIRKLKADFPQLELPVDEGAHTASHRNHAGPRKAFEWGSLAAAADAAASEGAAAVVPPPPPPPPAAPAPPPAAAVASATAASGGGGTDGKFCWGSLPSVAAETTDVASSSVGGASSESAAVQSEPAGADAPTMYVWGPVPPG